MMSQRPVPGAIKVILLAGAVGLLLTALPTALAQGDDINALIDAAIAYLGERLGTTITGPEVSRWTWQETIWPDAALGCPQPDQTYEGGARRGYIIRLEYAAAIYEVHITAGGDIITLCGSEAATTPTPLPPSEPTPGDDPEALVALGKAYLQQQLGAATRFVRWTWQEAVWPDDSLGCPYPELAIDDSFPQRGYIVRLDTADTTYELHITADGDRVMPCVEGLALLPMIGGQLFNPVAAETPPAVAALPQPSAAPTAAASTRAGASILLYTGPDGNVYRATLDSLPGQAITTDTADTAPPSAPLPVLNHDYGYFRWSPDGALVAFVDNIHPYRLLLTDAAGAPPVVLAENLTPLYPPAWSPTGDAIAYVTPTQTFRGNGQVMAIYAIAPPTNGVVAEPRLIGTFEQAVGCGGGGPDPAEGAYQREVGFSGNGLAFHWLPDGSFLFSNSCLGVGLSRLDTATGDITVIAPQLARLSLDPLRQRAAGVVFASAQERQLVLVDLASGERQAVPLTHTPDQVRWSADGQRLFVSTVDAGETLPLPDGEGAISIFVVRLWEINLETGSSTLHFEQEGRGIGQMVEAIPDGGLVFSFVESAQRWQEAVASGAETSAQRAAAPATWLLYLNREGQIIRLGQGGQPSVSPGMPAAQG